MQLESLDKHMRPFRTILQMSFEKTVTQRPHLGLSHLFSFPERQPLKGVIAWPVACDIAW